MAIDVVDNDLVGTTSSVTFYRRYQGSTFSSGMEREDYSLLDHSDIGSSGWIRDNGIERSVLSE